MSYASYLFLGDFCGFKVYFFVFESKLKKVKKAEFIGVKKKLSLILIT
jgi:hypothetical protein